MARPIDPEKLNANVATVARYADLGEMFMFYLLMYTTDNSPLFPGMYGAVSIIGKLTGPHTGGNYAAGVCGHGFTGDSRIYSNENAATIPITAAYGGREYRLYNARTGDRLQAPEVGNLLTFNGVAAKTP